MAWGLAMKVAIIAAASAVALMAAPAIAADMTLPVKAPPVAPAPAASGWTGFYLGADAGLSATDAKWTATNFVQQLLVAGVPIGTTTGLRPERSPPRAHRSATCSRGSWAATSATIGNSRRAGWPGSKATWVGPATPESCRASASSAQAPTRCRTAPISPCEPRGTPAPELRLGFLVTPTSLIYVTGGGMRQHLEATFSCSSPITCNGAVGNNAPFSFTTATNRPDATVGGGIEDRSSHPTGCRARRISPPRTTRRSPPPGPSCCRWHRRPWSPTRRLTASICTTACVHLAFPPTNSARPRRCRIATHRRCWSKPVPWPRRRSRGPALMPVSTPASTPSDAGPDHDVGVQRRSPDSLAGGPPSDPLERHHPAVRFACRLRPAICGPLGRRRRSRCRLRLADDQSQRCNVHAWRGAALALPGG